MLSTWVALARLPGGLNLESDNAGEISLNVLVVQNGETQMVVDEVLRGTTLLIRPRNKKWLVECTEVYSYKPTFLQNTERAFESSCSNTACWVTYLSGSLETDGEAHLVHLDGRTGFLPVLDHSRGQVVEDPAFEVNTQVELSGGGRLYSLLGREKAPLFRSKYHQDYNLDSMHCEAVQPPHPPVRSDRKNSIAD